MKRIVLAALMAIAPLSSAWAAQTIYGQCRIEVDGKLYVNGPCGREILGKSTEHTTIIIGERRRPALFVFLATDADMGGKFDAFWSGPERNYHADEQLGEMSKVDGNCYANNRAKVCWRGR